ncbi:MAG: BMP family ABC transporter substrate-binding protein [bacterium]
MKPAGRRAHVAVMLLVLLAGCGGKHEEAAGRTAPGAARKFRVGVVFDVGGKGDRSFNDSAYEGLRRAAARLPIEVSDFEPGADVDREVGLRKLASRGYDLVIGIGFLFTDAIRTVAKDHPEVHFALVDGRIEDLPNVASLVFREQEGSFLVGALAALTSKTGTVGFVGGMDVPLIHKFEAGYRAGVAHVRPATKVLVGYAGVRPEAFSDPVRGKEIALSQIAQGADVVFHASGVTGLGVIEAAKERGVYAIGVDSNQDGVAPGTVLTSMIKRVDVAVERAIEEGYAGRFRSGIVEFGLADEGVGFSVDENNRALLSAGLLARAAGLRDSIVAGGIVVPAETGRR